jgi:4-amino-4-deoxy-L-arabinose transferase-like glycosyltransferase
MLKLLKMHYVLIGVLLLAAILRTYGININPPSLNWDEVSHGYNAYSILHSGRDEWGQFMPTIFRAYGDYKLPVYIYTTVLSVAIFGLNTFAIRIPSIIAGIFLVFYTYRLSKMLFTEKIALISAFLIAVEPWGLFLSRIALEANLAQALIVAGIYYLLLGLQKDPKKIILSAILLGLSVWTYNSARVFVPLLLFLMIIGNLKQIKKIIRTSKLAVCISAIAAAVLFVPMFLQLMQGSGQARYQNVSIINEGAIAVIEENRNSSNLPALVSKAVYNRPTYFVTHFTKNYISHFSPKFLFISGGSDYQFNIPGAGLLYLVNAPFFYIGFGYLAKESFKNNKFRVILLWLILAPVAASITRESPHTLRSIVSLPIPMLLSALGLVSAISYFKVSLKYEKVLLTLYTFSVFVFLASYLSSYFNDYRTYYSWSWQHGHEEMAELINQKYSDYEKIVVSKKYGEPHEFLLFYGAKHGHKWSREPEGYFNDPNLLRFNQSNWWWVDRFDKFYFVNDWEVPKEFGKTFVMESEGEIECNSSDQKCLLVTSPGNAPENWTKLETIYFLDGKPALEIYAI